MFVYIQPEKAGDWTVLEDMLLINLNQKLFTEGYPADPNNVWQLI